MESLIKTFYDAFNNLDAETMLSCYHKDITFEDPAFGKLNNSKTKAMWKMLCDSQKGNEKKFKITVSNIKIEENNGTAYWEAFYTFSKTGRKIHNKINASFKLKDGLIIDHKDDFNLHRWAKQALGFKGFLLGGTSFFKTKLKKQTNSLLERYIQKNN